MLVQLHVAETINTTCQVLGHGQWFPRLNAHLLQGLEKPDEVLVPIQLLPALPAMGPGKDAGDGLSVSRLAFLELLIVAGDHPMSSLSLNGLPIQADQHRCH